MSIQSVAATATLVAISVSGIGFLLKHQDGIGVFLHGIAGTERTGFCTRTEAVRNKIMGRIKIKLNGCNYITDSLLDEIKELDLSDSSIRGLQSGDFAGLTKLEKLELRNNQLSKLPIDVFVGLRSLKTLDLAENQLSALPVGVFSSLSKLQNLDLWHNRLDMTGLPEGVFNDLGELEQLRLGANHLDQSDLNHPVFRNLGPKVVDLGQLDDSDSTKTG